MLKKKIITYLCISTLSLSVFAGCAKKAEQKEGAASNDQTKQKVYIFQNSGAYNGSSGGSNADKLEEVKKFITDASGVEPIVIIPPAGSATEKLNLLLSSDEPLDLFWGDWQQYAPKGAVEPLNDLLEKHGQDILKGWPQESWNMMKDKEGKVWGMPRTGDIAVYPTFIRNDWLQKLGLEMPKTFEDLENILKAFKEKDPSGTGETIPLIADKNGLEMGYFAGFLEGGSGNWVDKATGKVKLNEFRPEYKEFIQMLNGWYKKGYLFKETFSSTGDRYKELIKQNKVGTVTTWGSTMPMVYQDLKDNVPEQDYQMVHNLQGPKGKIETLAPAGTNALMIAKKSKNKEAAIKLVNWEFKNLDNNMTSWYGIKGKDWNWVDEENRVYKRLTTDYGSEFVTGLGSPLKERIFITEDPKLKFYLEWYRDYQFNYERTKKQDDYGVLYDNKQLEEEVPTLGDITRLRQEGFVKFVTGARPMTEWGKYLEELTKAGADKWSESVTKQYNERKK
jgi:putative aldouronate transport system substrate-binding protein